MNEAKNHDLVEKTVREACAVAKKLNVNKMCVVGGNDVPGVSQEEMHEQIIKEPHIGDRREIIRKVEEAALAATPTHQMKGLLA